MSSCLVFCFPFFLLKTQDRLISIVWVTLWEFYKKQHLLTSREHMCSLPVYIVGVHVPHRLVFCVVFFCFSLFCVLCTIAACVSWLSILDWPFGCRSTMWNVQGPVSDIPFRISMEELPPEWWQIQCTYVLHRWLICCITWYNYITFCPNDCITILFHVFCQYTIFKIVLIIYAAIL